MSCASLLAAVPACTVDDGVDDPDDIEDGKDDRGDGKADSITSGSVQAAAIIAMVNDASTDQAELDHDAGLSTRVARNIMAHRDGADRRPGTADDDLYGGLAELDGIPYVGPAVLKALLAHATARGFLTPATWRRIATVPVPFPDRYFYGLGHQVVRGADRVLVSTPDGVWSSKLSGGEVKRVGLAGVNVMFIHVDPADPSRIYAGGVVTTGAADLATFYISSDGGLTFRGASSPKLASTGGYLGFSDFTFVPGKPNHLMANGGSGATVLVSTDRGATWAISRRDVAGDELSYPCHVLALDPGRIVQGCEVPLDEAWVGVRSIAPLDPLDVGPPRKLLANHVPGLPDIGNRRPNLIEPAGTPTSFFVGVEGGLYKYDLATSKGTWWYDEPVDSAFGTYVGALWLDPADAQHVIFGGFDKRSASFSLLETRDGGQHVSRLTPPGELRQFPHVHDIVPTSPGRFDVVLSDMPDAEDPLGAVTYMVYELTTSKR